MRIARAALHFWEEPPISGTAGSGTVFFVGCGLRCVYCQNQAIQSADAGIEISAQQLCRVMLALQHEGASNINFVTGSHFAPDISEAVSDARASGLRVPVVWNSSGYETVDAVSRLTDTVDVFLPDFKYWSTESASCYSGAPDYPVAAMRAIAEMKRLRPDDEYDEKGIMRKGVLIRHLVLPGHTLESKQILIHLRNAYGPEVAVSVMRQYTPAAHLSAFPELTRTVTTREYESVLRHAERIGLENVYVQDRACASIRYIPDFGVQSCASLQQFLL